MSTNSTIRIKRKDGTETGIYCHWDGYIEGVGATLQLAYNTPEKIEKLLALGNLSSLGYYVEPVSDIHSFENPEKFVCVAYHRDRDEEFRQSNCDNEYIYTFDESDGVWYVEFERFNKSMATESLHLSHCYLKHQELLLDELMKCDFSNWVDDEFATADNIFDTFTKKALEPRQAIIEEEMESYQSYWSVYCD